MEKPQGSPAKTILQGVRTLVHLELREKHGFDGAEPGLWDRVAVAIKAADRWRDPTVRAHRDR